MSNFNLEFQQKILYHLLNDIDFFKKYPTILTSKHFENNNCRLLCKLIIKFFQKYKEIPDKVSLIQKIDNINIKSINKEDIKKTIINIFKCSTHNLQYTKDSVLLFAQTQAFKEHVIECADHITNSDISVDKLSLMRSQMDKVIHIGSQLEEAGHRYFNEEDIEERILNRQGGIRRDALSTGIPYLDYTLGGGICKQELGVILAPSNRGKSLVLVHLGKAAVLTGANVFHYVIEGNVRSISNRYDACFLGEYYHKLHEFDDALREKMISVKNKFKAQLIIKKLPYVSSTTIDIINHIDLVERLEGIKPDLIIIDYADVMSPSYNKYKDKRNEQSQIFIELKILLAEERDVRVWTGSQSNRSAVKKVTVKSEDIGESFTKVQISDIIITLNQTDEEKNDIEGEKMRMFLSKMRDAQVGKTVYLNLDKHKMYIDQDIEKQQLEEPTQFEYYVRYLREKRDSDSMSKIKDVLIKED